MADVVNTRGMNEARSVIITLEAYFDFFSASFLNSSLSTGVGRLDRAFGCVIRTSMKVFSFFPYRPVATISSLAASEKIKNLYFGISRIASDVFFDADSESPLMT